MGKPTGSDLAQVGFKYLGTPYSTMDCQAFVEKCLRDVGINKDLAGSNAWYRFVMQNGWIGSPEECKAKYGSIPVGAFLFILNQDGKEPEKYKPDGIGNASHIGIYTAQGEGAIHSSASRGCVCESKFAGKSINGGWNQVGLWDAIDYGVDGGGTVETIYQARVVGGSLNMRKAPSASADRVCQIPDGTIVTVTEENGDWRRTSYSGKTGWVYGFYLEKVEGDSDTVTVSRKGLESIYDEIGDWLGLRG